MISASAWLERLEKRNPNKIKLGLERVAKVAKALHLDTFDIPVITVAGTNGKGSCVAALEALFLAGDYRVGAYTSPHLYRYHERIRVNGQMIADEALGQAFAAIDAQEGADELSYFEFGTLAALYHFQQTRLDVILLEVGLGGRLDAVNIVDADVAVITTIDIDHTEWLGHDRETIAKEKAGIFRAGKPAIYGEADMPQSVQTVADELGADLYQRGVDFDLLQSKHRQGERWSWYGLEGQRYAKLPLPDLTLDNVATALMASTAISDRLPLHYRAVRDSMRGLNLPGRFQCVPGPVQQILDVAHNPHAAKNLAKHLATVLSEGKRSFAVFSMLQDKDIVGPIAPLAKLVDEWCIAPLSIPRAAPQKALEEALQANGVNSINDYSSISLAHQAACQMAKPGDTIVIFGSFYTVAAVGDIS